MRCGTLTIGKGCEPLILAATSEAWQPCLEKDGSPLVLATAFKAACCTGGMVFWRPRIKGAAGIGCQFLDVHDAHTVMNERKHTLSCLSGLVSPGREFRV